MDPTLFAQVAPAFAAFHQRFAPLFGRPEARRRSEQYVRGLLVQQTDRRNAENVAEAIDGATPRALQRFLTEAPWSADAVMAELQAFVGERLAAADGAGVFAVDDTGFPKQGTKSVGVARQYRGTLGKVGNCQLGVLLTYVTARGHALVDRRLYLHRSWTDDRARCRAAGVPDTVTYQSKTDLAREGLRQIRERGQVPGRWVTADELYGQVPDFRDGPAADGWWYVLEVPRTTPVCTTPAATYVPPAQSRRGRPPTRRRLRPGGTPAQAVAVVAEALPANAWRELTVAEGAQGPRRYQFWAQRVWERRDEVPGRACWLMLRRNLDASELKYYLSNAPADTELATLAWVGAMRWPVETDFQTSKGETGLDEYEVRGWSGWHHHVTLALLAGAFLLQLEQEWGEKAAQHYPSPTDARAARAAPTPDVSAGRPVGLAGSHRAAQRPCQSRACHPSRPSAA